MLRLSPFITVYCCAVAALLGACTGSFLACLAWRTVHGESVLRGRSHCDVCGHVLGVRDLVPVFSYLLSGGKCRYCGAKLSARHVWGELISAAVFVSLLLQYDISLQTLEAWLLACVLLACTFADLEGYIIPDRFVAAGVVLFIAALFWEPEPLHRALDGALGGVTVAGGLLLLSLYMDKRMKRETLGGGDIKLMAAAGLFLGWQNTLLAMFFGIVFGGMYGIYLLAAKKAGKKDHFAFGPFLCAGIVIAMLFGGPVLEWYCAFL